MPFVRGVSAYGDGAGAPGCPTGCPLGLESGVYCCHASRHPAVGPRERAIGEPGACRPDAEEVRSVGRGRYR